ncbi:MAG: hypothetical protein ACYC2R_03715 [Burkholderiales bacterium]
MTDSIVGKLEITTFSIIKEPGIARRLPRTHPQTAYSGPNSSLHEGDPSIVIPLPAPTDDTRFLIQAALAGLRGPYRPGFKFMKAGVIMMLMGIAERKNTPGSLFESGMESMPKAAQLIEALDRANRRYGKNTMAFASSALEAVLTNPDRALATSWFQGATRVAQFGHSK